MCIGLISDSVYGMASSGSTCPSKFVHQNWYSNHHISWRVVRQVVFDTEVVKLGSDCSGYCWHKFVISNNTEDFSVIEWSSILMRSTGSSRISKS